MNEGVTDDESDGEPTQEGSVIQTGRRLHGLVAERKQCITIKGKAV